MVCRKGPIKLPSLAMKMRRATGGCGGNGKAPMICRRGPFPALVLLMGEVVRQGLNVGVAYPVEHGVHAGIGAGALVVAILVSCFTELNVGILALALAWIVGVYVRGMPLNDVIGGFPVSLFLTLAGVTLLFTQAQLNGTLDRIAHRAVRMCRGNAGLIPVVFFALGCGLASLGPGNVSTAALLAPMAMAAAGRAGIPAFLMIIMVGNGAQAGALSPFAPTGVIVNGLMENRTRWIRCAPTGPTLLRTCHRGLWRLRDVWWIEALTSEPWSPSSKAEDIRFDRTTSSRGRHCDASRRGAVLRVNVGMGAFAGAVVWRCWAPPITRIGEENAWSVIVMRAASPC